MNILSAIRQYTSPELQGLPLPKLDPKAPGGIPARELEGISPAIPQISIPSADAGGSFASMLGGFVGEVNDKQAAAGAAMQGLLAGQNVSLHQAMIAMEEASVSFQLMAEVRNKLVESYQELMRMQV